MSMQCQGRVKEVDIWIGEIVNPLTLGGTLFVSIKCFCLKLLQDIDTKTCSLETQETYIGPCNITEYAGICMHLRKPSCGLKTDANEDVGHCKSAPRLISCPCSSPFYSFWPMKHTNLSYYNYTQCLSDWYNNNV